MSNANKMKRRETEPNGPESLMSKAQYPERKVLAPRGKRVELPMPVALFSPMPDGVPAVLAKWRRFGSAVPET